MLCGSRNNNTAAKKAANISATTRWPRSRCVSARSSHRPHIKAANQKKAPLLRPKYHNNG